MQTRDKGGGEDGKDICTDEIDVDEGAVNCDVGVAAAAGVEAAEPSVGVSKPDGEVETKLSFFFRHSSLLLALKGLSSSLPQWILLHFLWRPKKRKRRYW